MNSKSYNNLDLIDCLCHYVVCTQVALAYKVTTKDFVQVSVCFLYLATSLSGENARAITNQANFKKAFAPMAPLES